MSTPVLVTLLPIIPPEATKTPPLCFFPKFPFLLDANIYVVHGVFDINVSLSVRLSPTVSLPLHSVPHNMSIPKERWRVLSRLRGNDR